MSRVICSAATPCATRWCDRRRTSAATAASAAASPARCSASVIRATDSRCRVNRSRSLTTPITRSTPSSALHDGDMANAVLGHQQARIRRGLRRVERPHTARHHGGHRRIERHAGQDHASDQVGARQDADRLLAAIVALDHDDRTDVQGMHALEHLAQRLVRCARQRRAARQFSQRGAHGALDARFVRIACLELLARQVQQGAEAAPAEVEKHLAAAREFVELGALQAQTERVANGDVLEADRTFGQQRADRKAVADAGLEARARRRRRLRRPSTRPCLRMKKCGGVVPGASSVSPSAKYTSSRRSTRKSRSLAAICENGTWAASSCRSPARIVGEAIDRARDARVAPRRRCGSVAPRAPRPWPRR